MTGIANSSSRQSTRQRWLLAAAIVLTAVTIVARPGRDSLSGAVPPPAQYAAGTASAPASANRLRQSPAASGPTFDRLDVSGLTLAGDPAAARQMKSIRAARGYAPPVRSRVVWSNKAGTITNAGLVAQYCCAGPYSTVVASKAVGSGRHYWEVTLQVAPGDAHPDTYTSPGVAIATGSSLEHGLFRTRTFGAGPRDPSTLLTIDFGKGRQYQSGDTFMFALDADRQTVYHGVNGTWTNGTPGAAGGDKLGNARDSFLPIARVSSSSSKPVGDSLVANFGGSNFRYPIPVGYGAYGTYTRSAQGSAAVANDSGGGAADEYSSTEIEVGGRKLPLPEGRWLELARFESRSPTSADEAVILAKPNGMVVESLLAIRAGGGYRGGASCGRQDVLHIDVDRNEANGPQRCWWVNHSGDGWLNDSAIAAAVSAAGLRNLSVPQAMVNVGIRSADSDGHLLFLHYADPSQAGISTAASDWAASPWHPGNLKLDRIRGDYVAERIDWGKNWAPIVYAYR